MDTFIRLSQDMKVNWRITIAIVVLLGITAVTCLGIIFQTSVCIHPDSRYHLHGFAFYEENWWPPEINSDELVYSPYGFSRVYSGEIVYLIYGKIIGLFRYSLKHLFGNPPLDLVNPYPVCAASWPLASLLNSILF
ncbi:MAG: hypothetical protein MUO62_15625, partial [Anaerolineales bacterium]|nr:hypothetical protein [Anaerolineales bacterium]